jgi:hypothetical protein
VRAESPPGCAAEVRRFLSLLWQPGDIREVRIPKHNRFGSTASGYFDDLEKLISAVAAWDGRANIYVTLNPVDPALLARANNRIINKATLATADADVLCRRWFPIDIDPNRPAGISSTDVQLDGARLVLDAVTGFLADEGWLEPIVAMSGNGYYALYRIDLPNDTASLELVRNVLAVLAVRFDTEKAHIDTSVFNASRIVGLFGTMKVKGDPLPDRPHRRSHLESVPERLLPVPRGRLEAMASGVPTIEPAQARASTKGVSAPVRLDQLLQDLGIEYREQPPDANGVTWYHVERCPFHDDGPAFECGVGQKLPDGPYAGHCFHNRGAGKGWQEWKVALGLDAGGRRHDPVMVSGQQRQIMVTDRHLHALAQDGWDALLAGNSPPVLFRHGGVIAEIGRDDDGCARISHLALPGLRGRLDRCAEWLRQGKEGLRPAWPPKEVVEDMLALPRPLPVLRGVVSTPVFAASGSLLTDAGYQPDTGLYYEPSGEALPSVPQRPDATDLQRAKEIVRLEWLSDFPFVDEASCANAVAAPLTAAAREMIDGPTPLFAIDSPVAGTGKGLLAHGIGIIGLGAPPAVMTETRNEEEMRKRITSSLCAGLPVVLLDNVKRPLQSGALAAALTARQWSDRILGRNQIVELPIRCVWLATGNNLQLDNEIARRTVWVRLDARVDRPWQRTSFRHPDLPAWLRRHRHELVWAILVLVQHWIAVGRPAWDGVALGSYEAWSSVVGGILQAAGIGGFLENREELYARTDAETEEWRLFVGAWWEAYAEAPVKAGELYALCRDQELLPSVFAGAKDDATDRALTTRLGLALRRRRDRCFGDLVVRTQADAHQKATMYRLEAPGLRDVEGNVPQISANVPQENTDSRIQLRDVRYLAGPFSDLRARKTSPEQDVEGTALNVPQRPAGPADRFKTGADPAGPSLLTVSNVPHNVPQPQSEEPAWVEEVP